MKQYRYELKFIIAKQMGFFLKHDLRNIMDLDPNSRSNQLSYFIRSLYFDDPFYTAYREKVDGVEYRTKYRIRMYNQDPQTLRLECKQKAEAMTAKEQILIDQNIALKLINGDIYDIALDQDNLLSRFLVDKRHNNLVPAVIVDYDRLAFTYPFSDVRITFDENVRSGVYNHNLFDVAGIGIPIIKDYQSIVEVKFNEYLPESLVILLDTVPKFRLAISKFAFSCMVK